MTTMTDDEHVNTRAEVERLEQFIHASGARQDQMARELIKTRIDRDFYLGLLREVLTTIDSEPAAGWALGDMEGYRKANLAPGDR